MLGSHFTGQCERRDLVIDLEHDNQLCIRNHKTMAQLRPDGRRKQDYDKDLVWYFAYGSNMSSQKFRYGRGITPLAVANVAIPGWCLTMDVAGLPYKEPGMSSITPRQELYPPVWQHDGDDSSKIPAARKQDVTGVAYLVTLAQHIMIVRSEGGGIAYDDVTLEARPLTPRDREAVSGYDRLQVRTLVCVPSMSRRDREPLPSVRYKSLLTSGAAEAGLPQDYHDMLDAWPTFTRPSRHMRRRACKCGGEDDGRRSYGRCRFVEDGDNDDNNDDDDDANLRRWIGALVFIAIFSPILVWMEKLTMRSIRDEDGLAPGWVKWTVRMAVRVIWLTHDVGFAPIFGRGDGREDLDQSDEESKAERHSSDRSDWNDVYSSQYLVGYEKGLVSHETESMRTVWSMQPIQAQLKRNEVFWTS